MATLRVILLYLLYIVLIGSITVAIVLSLHSNKTPKVATKTTTSQTQVEPGANPGSAGTAAGNAGASAGQNVANSGGSNTGTATTPSQLTNTGPGNVVALFAAATILGTLAHRRHLAKTS